MWEATGPHRRKEWNRGDNRRNLQPGTLEGATRQELVRWHPDRCSQGWKNLGGEDSETIESTRAEKSKPPTVNLSFRQSPQRIRTISWLSALDVKKKYRWRTPPRVRVGEGVIWETRGCPAAYDCMSGSAAGKDLWSKLDDSGRDEECYGFREGGGRAARGWNGFMTVQVWKSSLKNKRFPEREQWIRGRKCLFKEMQEFIFIRVYSGFRAELRRIRGPPSSLPTPGWLQGGRATGAESFSEMNSAIFRFRELNSREPTILTRFGYCRSKSTLDGVVGP